MELSFFGGLITLIKESSKKSYFDAPRMIKIGLPPAGGCATPNNIIIKIPRLTATPICKNWSIGKNFRINTPAKDVRRCPKKTFFGCANGLSGYPKRRTIEDPNDPAKKIPYGVLKLKNERVLIVIIENIKAIIALLKFSFFILIIYFFSFFKKFFIFKDLKLLKVF